MSRAFLSHSTADDRYVAELESFLRAAGLEVFNDVSSIQPDETFWPKIQQGIAACDTLLVVITAGSNTSTWVPREVEYARSLSKKVIPLWVEDCPLPAIFTDRDVVDLRPTRRELRRTDISRIFKYAPAELIGRDGEKKLISDAWGKVLRVEKSRPNILTFVALGGEGKTSLVAKWVVDEMSAQDWPGCDAAFAWSFYSQGTREQAAVSSDLFLAEALTFFGDAAMAGSAAGAFDKGRRLAELVGERRALLILDGLEPLQYAPTSPTPGELKDQGIAALLKGLAASSHGLCIVTTRYALPDLRAFLARTVREEKLTRLSRAASVQVLKAHGVTGSDRRNIPLHDGDGRGEEVSEFEKLVEEVKGHALTLNLLGTYLRDAHAGDIRKVGLVKLEEANAEEQGGHAFHVMDAYVKWLEGGETNGKGEGQTAKMREKQRWWRRWFSASPPPAVAPSPPALAILRLMGFFDRPATAGCLTALWTDYISGLTEPLIGLGEARRNVAIKRLEAAKLLTVNRAAGSGELVALDAHPLLREYFALRVREQQPEAWRAAHRRLYEYLCASTQEGDQPTLEDLQPLYQAVAHGCQAGLQQEACDQVYIARILQGMGNDGFYSWKKLGAFGSNLGAIACFFEQPWSRVATQLIEPAQAWLLNETAIQLRALGRPAEALEPFRAGLAIRIKQEAWLNAARFASNLSELELTLGEVAGAVGDAEQSVTYADRSGDAFMRNTNTARLADALHQAGRRAEAETRFRETEHKQTEIQPDYPLLYSVSGFQYCDLLLAAPERAAWQIQGGATFLSPGARAAGNIGSATSATGMSPLLESCRAVSQRAAQTLKWLQAYSGAPLLDIALDHLTLGRAALYAAILGNADCGVRSAELEIARRELDTAVDGLRHAGQQQFIPLGLLTRGWLRFLTGAHTGPESAQEDLDEAWEIAERGPMPLFMADIHLYRARLFGNRKAETGDRKEEDAPYPWNQHPDSSPGGAEDDLAEARRLIVKHGYLRRMPELEDAEAWLRS